MAAPPDERKERVIHARVPESLDEEIKRKAGNLGVSVSNLVRNILEHTVELVEDVVVDSARIARSARGDWHEPEEPGRRESAFPEPATRRRILGWQSATLEINAVCDTCNAILARGTRAGIAVTEGGGVGRFRCERCLEELVHGEGGSSPGE